MKRFISSVAVVILASAWSSPAKAQYGIGGFGEPADMSAEVDAMRAQQKGQANKYTRAPVRGARSAPTRSYLSNATSTDPYGRMDLAGHPVAGYPSVRSGSIGHTPPAASRNGAHAYSRRGSSRRR
jgi:hypothetical protein